MPPRVTIIGAGLAGSEATWQLVRRGIPVALHEMRPQVMTKAHKTGMFAELVCSNSFRGADLANAVGLLKEELKQLGSLVMSAALEAQVPAGGALAVDREVFSASIDKTLRDHPLVSFSAGEVREIPTASHTAPVIIATGPLTSASLAKAIEAIVGTHSLAFFDAISPIIVGDTIDLSQCFRQSRYDKGEGADYINIPLSEEQYYTFVSAVERGEKFSGHSEVESDSIDNLRPFEGCMPIEDMVERGKDTLLFGPLKPVGLTDPRTGNRPYAVIQLRQDDKAGTLWSMVGMQTRLKQPEQVRIFRSLPGLENAEFVRLGSVHRNTFINSPTCLNPTLEFRGMPGLFFAGQITGVEGYVESTAGGMLAGMNAALCIQNKELITFPASTAIGGLMHYISSPERAQFQPMNISFGLIQGYVGEVGKARRKLSKRDRRLETSRQALAQLSSLTV